jgi:ArsR family transcriptional regulator, lead/cadmium/zinc/bismuth-responsive transcriptional repressor
MAWWVGGNVSHPIRPLAKTAVMMLEPSNAGMLEEADCKIQALLLSLDNKPERFTLSLIGMTERCMKTDKGGCEHNRPPRSPPKLPEGHQLEGASAMFRALGDPSRLRLLARISQGEVCVSELADLEDEKLSTVSARLQMLYAVRLVKRRREAKHIFYAIADDHVLQLVQSALGHAAERR